MPSGQLLAQGLVLLQVGYLASAAACLASKSFQPSLATLAPWVLLGKAAELQARGASQPGSQPASKSASQPTRPASQPTYDLDRSQHVFSPIWVRSCSKEAGNQPTSQPNSRPTNPPSDQPTELSNTVFLIHTQAAKQLTNNLDNQVASRPTKQPANQPNNQQNTQQQQQRQQQQQHRSVLGKRQALMPCMQCCLSRRGTLSSVRAFTPALAGRAASNASAGVGWPPCA